MVKQRKTEGKDCRGCSFSSASCFEIFVGLLCLQRNSRILKSDAVSLNDFLPLLCVGQTKGNDPFLVSSCIQTTLAILFLLFEFLSFSISFFFFRFHFHFSRVLLFVWKIKGGKNGFINEKEKDTFKAQ